MASNFNISYLIELKDKYTGVANKLKDVTEKLKKKFAQLSEIIKKNSKKLLEFGNAAKKAGEKLKGFSLVAGIALGIGLKRAIDFENKMADIKKVVEFKDPEGLKKLGKSLKDISETLPISAVGLAEITAAGGQLGILEKDLLGFTKITAKMSVAFDMVPAEAGNAVAKLKNIFGISVNEMETFGDKINAISDNSASKASEIIRSLQNKGAAAGLVMNLNKDQTAALASSFIQVGVNAERVGSIMDSMGRRLNDTSIVGRRFANAMQKDGQVALLKLFKSISKLEGVAKQEALKNYFGEFSGRIGLLIDKMDLYKNTLNLVGDESKFAGSMSKELANRLGTTGAKLTMARNQLDNLAIELAETLFPAITLILKTIKPVFQFLRALPAPIKGIIAGFIVLTATIAPLLIVFGMIITSIININKAFLFVKAWNISLKLFEMRMMLAGRATLIMAASQRILRTTLLATAINARLLWAALMGPLGLVVIGIGLLVAALIGLGIYLYKTFEPFKNFIDGIFDKIKAIGNFIGSSLGFDGGDINVNKQLAAQDININEQISGAAALSSKSTMDGVIRVEAEPGTRITQTKSETKGSTMKLTPSYAGVMGAMGGGMWR